MKVISKARIGRMTDKEAIDVILTLKSDENKTYELIKKTHAFVVRNLGFNENMGHSKNYCNTMARTITVALLKSKTVQYRHFCDVFGVTHSALIQANDKMKSDTEKKLEEIRKLL